MNMNMNMNASLRRQTFKFLQCLLLSTFMITISYIDAFVPSTIPKSSSYSSTSTVTSTTSLFGAFHKRNKQGDLKKKMEEAKRQRENAEIGGDSDTESDGSTSTTTASSAASASASASASATGKQMRRKSDDEIKIENDMKRFEQLLNSEAATINYGVDGSTDNYLTKQQEEDEMEAGFKGLDRIFEGDPAKVEPFHDLVRIDTNNAIGEAGTKRLLPWLNANTSKHLNPLIIISDPRPKSSELRTAMRSLMKLDASLLRQMIVINADTPAENRRYLKKQGITSINVYCDEKREWMRDYTALGEKRWAMCMFIVADGRVQKVVRELDSVSASGVVLSAVKSLNI